MRHALPAVLAALLLVAGCQTKPSTPGQPGPPTGPQIQPALQPQLTQDPVTPRQRAEIHAELAAGYYERAQMDVALEELGIAERLDPTYPRIFNLYGLVYTAMGELPRRASPPSTGLMCPPTPIESFPCRRASPPLARRRMSRTRSSAATTQ